LPLVFKSVAYVGDDFDMYSELPFVFFTKEDPVYKGLKPILPKPSPTKKYIQRFPYVGQGIFEFLYIPRFSVLPKLISETNRHVERLSKILH
jgi:hypothetical protein